MIADILNYSCAVGRWVGLGPYYAMFPVDFAFDVIRTYSKPGDTIIDPFAGRASSIYAAAVQGRNGIGIEINPVGWLYGKVKLQPASKIHVMNRLREIYSLALSEHLDMSEAPEFFRLCFSSHVYKFLLTARSTLRWQTSKVDATLMAIILVNLHGRYEQSLSNQMRQSKAMSPDYSVRWWKERDFFPPDIDPLQFLSDRIDWRYKMGIPSYEGRGHIILGDSTLVSKKLSSKILLGRTSPYNLIFTSPPYYSITNYHYDQWLRLWMLGGPSYPTRQEGKWQKKFESQEQYRQLLTQVFTETARVSDRNCVVYVRTDARKFTFQTTLDVLKKSFPTKNVQIVLRPVMRKTQTSLFGDNSEKPGEIDIILT